MATRMPGFCRGAHSVQAHREALGEDVARTMDFDDLEAGAGGRSAKRGVSVTRMRGERTFVFRDWPGTDRRGVGD